MKTIYEKVLGLVDIQAAKKRVYRFAIPTPLLQVGPWILKLENLQPVRSFKIRGAANFILKNLKKLGAGVVTPSSGNHGSAVAYVCSKVGVPCYVTVPEDIPGVKRRMIEQLSGIVIPAGMTSTQRYEKAKELARQKGLTLVPSYDHPDIIAGQGTIGLELVKQRKHMGTVLVPVSGGGLISGIALALKTLQPKVLVIGVEPMGGRRYFLSRQLRHPVTLEQIPTIADGLRVVTPGEQTFPIIENYVDDFTAVDDRQIIEAMQWCATESGLIVEPSGAAALAAARAGSYPEPVVVIISGGNVDILQYFHWVTSGLT